MCLEPTSAGVKEPPFPVKFIVLPFLEDEMLKGDICAILAAVVYAIYMIWSAPVLTGNYIPLAMYNALMSAYVMGISFVLSWVFEVNSVAIFSNDHTTGIFTLFTER